MALARKVRDINKRLVGVSVRNQREGLLEITRLIAEVDDKRGPEVLKACEKEGIIARLVLLTRDYLPDAAAEVYYINLCLSSLTNLAFFWRSASHSSCPGPSGGA
mmetsp:Transcript_15546/g.41718  ORF Transcript_15546/g.41718 Transcript_15546/m.41718 type:complete len:105 (+) Transcript_15546:110-424(+)